MEDDGILTLDGIAEVRRATQDALMHTALRYSLIGVVAGGAFAAFGYFADWARTGDPTLTIVAGIAGVAVAAYALVHWIRHFRSLLSQLTDYETRVRNGESILASSVRFHSYKKLRSLEKLNP